MTPPYFEQPRRSEAQFRNGEPPLIEPHEAEAFEAYEHAVSDVASWQLRLIVLLAILASAASMVWLFWLIINAAMGAF